MSTTLAGIETIVRSHLREATPRYWTSQELTNLMVLGIHDLWRAVNDLKLNHFCTLDNTNVSLASSSTSLTGVPADCVRVHMLEPRDLSVSSTNKLVFTPLPYNDQKFQAARASSSIDPSSGGTIYWTQMGAGGPISAPTVVVAPTISSAVTLAFTYVPSLGTLTNSSVNPVPGESDNALICWTVAYARAKENESSAPDAGWLALYATEKKNLLASLAPRQNQEPDQVQAMFEPYWG